MSKPFIWQEPFLQNKDGTEYTLISDQHITVTELDGEDRIEIEVVKRTKQTITFKYTKPNWWEEDTEKEFRKKIRHFNNNYETINLGSHWSEPSVHAN